MMGRPLIDVIDDDHAIRDSIAFLLDVNGYEARVHADALSFLATARPADTACVISDIRMPGLSGLELMRRLSEIRFTPPVILITGHGDIPLAVEAMKAGVFDFIEKPFDDKRLLAAIREAMATSASGPDKSASEFLSSLSPRERDVLAGIVLGKTNKIIARDLAISPRTVEVYRANLMSKTGAKSLSELVRLAIQAGL